MTNNRTSCAILSYFYMPASQRRFIGQRYKQQKGKCEYIVIACLLYSHSPEKHDYVLLMWTCVAHFYCTQSSSLNPSMQSPYPLKTIHNYQTIIPSQRELAEFPFRSNRKCFVSQNTSKIKSVSLRNCNEDIKTIRTVFLI